jgi:hypothetical protein
VTSNLSLQLTEMLGTELTGQTYPRLPFAKNLFDFQRHES